MSQAKNPVPSTWSESRHSVRPRRWTDGVEGNSRLTSIIGLTLLILLFVEGVTVLGVRQMFTLHAFVGLLLIPPILLKLASTGYRFIRYYTGSRSYRAAGPPQPLLRMTAPLLVVTTVGLFGTGVILVFVGPSVRETWRQYHSLFFFFWFFLMTIHVLAYAVRVPRLALLDLPSWHGGAAHNLSLGSWARQGLLLGSLLLGLAIAIAAMPMDASWIHWSARLGPGR